MILPRRCLAVPGVECVFEGCQPRLASDLDHLDTVARIKGERPYASPSENSGDTAGRFD